MKVNGCPFCGSDNYDVVDNSDVFWGNNDQGTLYETLKCNDCGRDFTTAARVEVIHRELELHLVCPYCGEGQDVNLVISHEVIDDIDWYDCTNCNRSFAVWKEEHYAKKKNLEVC